jgi:TRAP-type C4-dicarboxylate transport system substrate-binding protein
MTKNIKWVLAHEPIELFLRAAKVFASEVNARANGALDIEVMTMNEYSAKYNNGIVVTKHELVDMINRGDIEMSQTYTVDIGEYDHEFRALDMPFLFESHDHATRVFEGPIGESLLAGLSQSAGVKGLAFTYSGGFRIIPGQEEVSRIEDLRGLKLRTSFSPVAIETFKAVGADVVPMELEEMTDAIQDKDIQVGESTYPRIYALGQDKVSKVINHTEHSLFLTSILINQDFWADLGEELQGIVADAAKVAANYERVISIEDVALTQSKAESDGIEVRRMSQEERARFKEATAHVYDMFPELMGTVKKIQDLK